jgi:GNAT superfamily N-acetyltransferase
MSRPEPSASSAVGDLGVVIRHARADELPALARLEHEADRAFASVGLTVVSRAPAPSPQEYEPALTAGRLLVAVADGGAVAGFVRIDIVDGTAHLHQVSVAPRHGARGLGRALVAAAERWAVRHGHRRLTLTTYRDVPWNGPFYARLGYVVLQPDALGPGLRALRDRERADGLEVRPRQAMVKELDVPGGPS